ncbi:EDD domain protein, DegV family [Halanaerobium congolense]|jgi:DegV family protein with EDD domain|uniref:EDD domain protein, DegV family n=1 Tax=Halanaerobium congolense TaxID=54121 RepID=A0A1H9Z6I1_9FIRM|nr:DegV family protein [Halanaerobium congolense]PTX17490.1 DegV family protein with EDD domain [Halanaerobium congolense]SDE98354.1 EDD domain protein, DegV family [Halanaerobium congolense]SES77169.1 EDD domain protein, DegV family [Halanaerobium congolense]SFP05026.1 EDD domain protein, DegV family [Halanaerobium congolense]
MSKVKIITDSCSDLPAEIVEEYDIEFLNIEVNINNQVYYDRSNLQPEEFYQLIETGNEVPKTSRITPNQFKESYQEALKNYDQILVIAFSSKLSGILESAVIAKKELNSDRITIIDSKAASIGQGLLVYQAAKMLKEDKTVEEVVSKTLEAASKLEHVFAVGDLEMLKRGGRISKTKAVMANVLNIKPILHILDGEILPYDKIRGKKRMISYLVNEVKKNADRPSSQVIALTHSKNNKFVLKLKEELENKFKPQEILISEMGAAVGSHAGPGSLAVVFKNSEKIAEPELY